MGISNKTEFLPQFRQLAAEVSPRLAAFPPTVSPCGICDGKDRQFTYKGNIVTCSRNHYCRGKALGITYFDSVCAVLP